MTDFTTFPRIYRLWPTNRELAEATGVKFQTARKWRERGLVPTENWPALIDAADEKGVALTADDLMRAYVRVKNRRRKEAAS